MEALHSNTAVYMLASRRHGTIYTGVSGAFLRRIDQHRQGLTGGFTARYGVKRLVWYEMHEGIETAIRREKSIKKYRREWKINLIEAANPRWEDLYPAMFTEHGPLAHLSWRPASL